MSCSTQGAGRPRPSSTSSLRLNRIFAGTTNSGSKSHWVHAVPWSTARTSDMQPKPVQGSVRTPTWSELHAGSQPPFWRTYQVLHRRVTDAHLVQHRLGGHAAVHAPHALRLAILVFDLLQEGAQCFGVIGVTGEHLIVQRQPLCRDDKR